MSTTIQEYTGIVLEDKPRDSRIIKVLIPELTPFYQGTTQPIVEKKLVKSGSDDTLPPISEIHVSNYFTATFFGDTNRRYPPDVRRSEQVRIYKIKDQDVLFWESYGRDDKLRTTERLHIGIAAKPDIDSELTTDNTYFLEFDSFKKHVVLKTSTANGESCKYLLKMDVDKGELYLCDDVNNEVYINSHAPRIRIKNKSGTLIDLHKENLLASALKDCVIKAGRQLVIDSPAMTFSNSNKSGTMVWNAKDVTMNLKKSWVCNSPAIGLNGAVVTDTVVAKHVQAEGFSTGMQGGNYSSSNIDLKTGEGNNPSNPPNAGGNSSSNRHCTAWEEFSEALRIVHHCLSIKNPDCPELDSLLDLANKAKMPLNRGK